MAKPLRYDIGISFETTGEEALNEYEAPDTTSLEKNLEATVETWAQENDISIDEIGISVGTTVTQLE
ncbi:hypothetical protein ES705_18697 [subsurface metagenome]